MSKQTASQQDGMDVILDEARKRDMKVWILDDSHFPTGFANGAVKTAPVELHRQGVCANKVVLDGEAGSVEVALDGLIPPPFTPVSMMEQYILPSMLEGAPHFEDDQVIALTAVNDETGEAINIPVPENGQPLHWQKPEGSWTVWVIGLSRNCGIHREYINMLAPDSCCLLIDAVYEKHWEYYADDFGKTIAGFFSDEPELGKAILTVSMLSPLPDAAPRKARRCCKRLSISSINIFDPISTGGCYELLRNTVSGTD